MSEGEILYQDNLIEHAACDIRPCKACINPLAKPPRPAVSGSMALHCRQELFLAGHGYPKEEAPPTANRTFDMGHMIEHAMFRPLSMVTVGEDGGLEEKIIGPWWSKESPGYVGTVRDNSNGKTIEADMSQLSDFQREVSFAGYKGHIDALLTLDTGKYVPDVKSTQGFGYDRHLTSVLLDDVFAREYIGQLHFYMAGLKAEGEDIAGAVLIFFNKEASQTMIRFVDYRQEIVDELTERLSWAKSEGEPEPDWAWSRGTVLGSGKGNILRCGYCSYRESCAQLRGFTLKQQFGKGNKPEWLVT